MASAIVVGEGKLAAFITKLSPDVIILDGLQRNWERSNTFYSEVANGGPHADNPLCSSGTPVALYGAGKPIRESIESMLQQHVEEIFPLQFVDDLRHQQDMVSRLMDNLRMTDDVSRLYGEVIIDATRASNSPLLRAVRRFFPDAPVMSLNGTASDEKTISVHLYEPFEITRIAKVIYPSPSNGTETSVARVRSILNKANVTELNAEQGDVAERALYAWRDQDASTPQLERVIASIVPNRTVAIDQTNAVLH